MQAWRRALYLLPLLLCGMLVFLFSSQSYEQQSLSTFLTMHVNKKELARILPDITIDYGVKHIEAKRAPFQFVEFIIRKCAHLIIYALLGALACLALRPYATRGLWKALLVLGGVFVIAYVDEWNQTFRAFRTGMIQDVYLDFLGERQESGSWPVYSS
ncbi:VanZ family protein [Paenibacillus sp. P26]|nr:VanZ family protein [Paenibacillus sp. P26]